MALDPLAVDVGAVKAVQILDQESALVADDPGMMAGYGDIVEEDVAVGTPADGEHVGIEGDGLPFAATAGADQEHGARGRTLAGDEVGVGLFALGRRIRDGRLVEVDRDEPTSAAPAEDGVFCIADSACGAIGHVSPSCLVPGGLLRSGLGARTVFSELFLDLVLHGSDDARVLEEFCAFGLAGMRPTYSRRISMSSRS